MISGKARKTNVSTWVENTLYYKCQGALVFLEHDCESLKEYWLNVENDCESLRED